MATVFSHTSDVLSYPDGPSPLRFLLTHRAIDAPISAIVCQSFAECLPSLVLDH